MNKVCVYTCITGDYDNLNEIVKEKNIDYYCFTNNKNIKSNTWNVIYIEDDKLDNQRLSRKIKMLGHDIINEKYDISVWMDADIIFQKSINDFVKEYLGDKSFASFKHNSRDCIYEEAKECLKQRKDTKENILKTVEFLRKENYPEHNGLYEMTVFIKRHNDKVVKETMNLWFDMVCNYSKRDQLSFMYSVWKTGLEINTINLSVWDNEWFTFKSHNTSKKISSYRVYFGDEKDFDYDMNVENNYRIKNNIYSFKEKVLDDVNEIRIEVTSSYYYKYDNVKINLKYDSIEYINSLHYKNNNYFIKKGIIVIHGNFKKGEELDFSICLEEVDNDFLIEMLADNTILYMLNKKYFEDINETYKKKFEDVINSTSWKITKPLRKITEFLKRK